MASDKTEGRSDRRRRQAATGRLPLRPPLSGVEERALSPTALRLLDGARRVLERSGYRAVTYESVGQEAGLSPNLIRYHFGGKSGLILALMDSIIRDTLWEAGRRALHARGGDDSIEELAGVFLTTDSDPRSYELFFDLLPHLLRDPRMRQQLAELLDAYVTRAVQMLGVGETGKAPDELKVLASLTVAASDGLAIQLLASPGSVNVELAVSLWRDFLESSIERIAQSVSHAPSAERP